MYFQYNNYRTALAATKVSIPAPQQERDAFGNLVRTVRTWQVEGEILADTQAEITTAIRALESAYNRDGGDAILFLPDGTTQSAHRLLSRDTIGGVRSSWVHYPDGDGVEYVNGRKWMLTLTAEYPGLQQNDSSIQTYDSAVSIVGDGGQEFVVRKTRNTKPVRQLVSRFTPVLATQQGQATAYGTWPQPDPPIWPQWYVNSRSTVTRTNPQQTGSGSNAFLQSYTTTWSYQFESPVPLTGFPSRRTR